MKYALYILIFIFPFALMILINENAKYIKPNQCSWKCHNNTALCKQNHTKLLKKYIPIIDILYNKMIEGLSDTGNYKLANVILLVILWPLFMFILLLKLLSFNKQIKVLKNE